MSTRLGNAAERASLTGSWPKGVDGDLTSELFRHPQDAHGHAVLGHGVR